ncbi:hypothetical protein J2Z44_002491 [Clostridium punense]|uniref:Uncharacterized protein n=1 Tax=Clostridium punense TaxID=1054297 RepID=A0ABS4K4H0_9CLOT|nr:MULTISPECIES: hypothetical protein [Clostridium]EQB86308.1 hypothetical protein M918_15330 [Clostridium sp. BL8]MBP2022668.1 hypothetical protein [Clostridium punense]
MRNTKVKKVIILCIVLVGLFVGAPKRFGHDPEPVGMNNNIYQEKLL